MAEMLLADRGGATMRTMDVGGGYCVPWVYKDPAEIKHIFDNITNISCRHDDVMIASYPKTGTNWIFEIAMMILRGDSSCVELNKVQTMLEIRSAQEIEEIPSPRVLNSHVNLRFLPKALQKKRIKTILIVRNPKDTAVSFYNHQRGFEVYDYNGKWDDWLPLFTGGELEYGHYADYLHEWEAVMQRGPDFPLHLVYYEDLKEHGVQEIIRLSKFLGVNITDQVAQEINKACGFKKMAEEKIPDVVKEMLFANDFQFFRKGEIGDWKNWFSNEQREHFDSIWDTKMEKSIFKFRYEPTRAKL